MKPKICIVVALFYPDISNKLIEGAINEFKKALRFHPRQYRARTALVELLEKQGRLDEAVRLMNDGVNYFYHRDISGLDEFYEYAIKLNLMSGDTTKARELQRKIVSLKEWRSTQSILLEN